MAVKQVGYATIDVAMVVFRSSSLEMAVDTANQVQVAPQTETTEAIKHIKDGRVLAQKPEVVTITSHQITLTDNIFYFPVVKMLQGGEITTDEDGNEVYTPPAVGSKDKGEIFEVDCYSAIYDESGEITGYERITYPGCKGTPISINSQDNTFRLPEYVINSYAKKGEPPYKITIVKELPEVIEIEPGGEENTEIQVQSYSDDTRIMTA